MRDLVVFCADVGSVKSGNFGWARSEAEGGSMADHDASRPADLAEAVVHELRSGRPVALGFECPLFVPVPSLDTGFGAARPGEGNRAWSAGAGSGALTTGLVQMAWVLAAVRAHCPEERLHLEWQPFAANGQGLLVWEAFVSASAKGTSHVDDATIGVAAFSRALPDPRIASTMTAERPLSLVGAAAVWSGWLERSRPPVQRTARHSRMILGPALITHRGKGAIRRPAVRLSFTRTVGALAG
jgi:hypothetical protein